MSTTVIKVENLSKQYRLGKIGTGSFAHDVNRWWHKIRGNDDPYLKIGESNDREKAGNSEYVWSLQDINFEIKQGDAVGIIGRNGAGKSTLLKILSRTTSPTKGSIKIKGRVASLLEVGTGFHPELTGRENVFLNGAILGMTKGEIRKKFDEIVDFAGVERYIDTPVKRYSSGMYVRLAFGVAAHLEPEILIVDEVLAVGDAEFQKKALGKMKDVSEGQGRTVLFVSHNFNAINTLTNFCLYLDKGQLVATGSTENVLSLYQNSGFKERTNLQAYRKQQLSEKKPIELISAELIIESASNLKVIIEYQVKKKIGSVVAIKIANIQGIIILTSRDTDNNPDVFSKSPGNYCLQFNIPIDNFSPNKYKITFSFSDMKTERFEYLEDLLLFEIEQKAEYSSFSSVREGVIIPNIQINSIRKSN